MAEKQDKPASGETNQNSETIFNSDIGDDWGEVFASEDILFSPDEEASSPFFLEEDGQGAAEAPSAAKEKLTPEAEVTEEDKSRQSVIFVYISSLLSRSAFYGQLIKAKFQALSRMGRLLAASAALLSVLFIVLFLLSYPHHEPGLHSPAALAPLKQAQTALPDKNNALTAVSPDIAGLPAAGVPSKVQSAPKESLEKVRKKWHLSSFLIAITPAKGKEPSILSIDLTMIMLLDKDKLPPENRKIFIRDLIFQFFNNQPLSKIQRYSLARGDMNRRLRAWIEKQWPNIPLAAIVFNRYQIL